MQPPVWGASGHCLREVNIEEEEEGEGSQKLFDAFDCFLNFSFCLNPCLVFKLTSRRAEKDQWPQHLGLRPALKAFRSSPHTTWAPGDKNSRLLVCGRSRRSSRTWSRECAASDCGGCSQILAQCPHDLGRAWLHCNRTHRRRLHIPLYTVDK